MSEPVTSIEEIIGYDALYESLMKCRKNVGWKATTGFYIHNWNTELLKLEDELKDGTYKKKKPRFFTLTEPKVREIMSIHFRDRIYLRSFNDNAVYPQITKSLIPDNFACQKDKGTDEARERLRQFLIEHFHKYGTKGYCLNCDIKGYYPNMDREFSVKVMKNYLDDVTYKIMEEELRSHPGTKGYNPGEQTIQNVGITALDPLDHYIKEKLRIRGYLRYMDDFKLIHPDKEYLEECLQRIREKLAEYKMELNDKKTCIQQLSEPISFLGYEYRMTSTGKIVILVKSETIKHEKKKLKRMKRLVEEGRLSKYEVDQHFKAKKASMRYGNNIKRIERFNKWYEELWKGET